MNEPLLTARFVERPNRFRVVAALVETGEIVIAHCPDPGRLRELLLPGAPIYLRSAQSPARKTHYDLLLVEHPTTGQLVSLDTRLPNNLFEQGLRRSFFPAFADYPLWRREVPLPHLAGDGVNSRIDFQLRTSAGDICWVEVKSATLVEKGVGLFPDAVTARGRRHLQHLAQRVQHGEQAAVVFIVQRPDAAIVRAHRVADPAFADALTLAAQMGVAFHACTCQVSLDGVTLHRMIEVDTGVHYSPV
jgi:sugar fermentation stimulation protein A